LGADLLASQPDAGATLAREFELSALKPDFYDDPYPTFAALRAHDPCRRLKDGSYFLSRYEDVMAVYRHPDASSDKKVEFLPKYGDSPLYEHHTTSLVFNDPPLHTRVRRLIMGAMNQRAINRIEPDVQALVVRLLDEMQEKVRTQGHLDLVADFAAAIPVEVIGNLLAIPYADRAPLRGWSLAILGALEPVLSDDVRLTGNQAVSEFSAYLETLIADRRKNPGNPDEDVLTRLILGEETQLDAQGKKVLEKLSAKELIHSCIFLLNAGHETTSNTIGNGTVLLTRFPEQQAKLRADFGLINSAIEEILRFESPVQLNNRRLLKEAEIAGQMMPAGSLISLGVGSANRDDAQFPQADQFDVARKPNKQLAFGHGDHACVGMNVARMEARIAIRALLERFPRMELLGQPIRDRRVRFRGYQSIPIILYAK
jgi:cytochrome P450